MSVKPAVSPTTRWSMIAEAAWYRFKARNFVHGYHEQDWIDSEREIDQQLARSSNRDDLAIIEGVGPKIAELLLADGLETFAKVSTASVDRLQGILDRAGPRFAMAVPTTWPQQAALAARGEWAALRKLQDVLDGGIVR